MGNSFRLQKGKVVSKPFKSTRFRPFREARTFVRRLGLKSSGEWYCYCKGLLTKKGKRPPDIPAGPWQVYADRGWKGFGDWLGTGAKSTMIHVPWRPFEKARDFARSLGLKSQAEWRVYCQGNLPKRRKRPANIPSRPEAAYARTGWLSYGDWLGTERVSTNLRQYRPFLTARAFVRSLGLKSMTEWRRYSAGRMEEKGPRPADIPSAPHRIYKDRGWSGYAEWLGSTSRRSFRPFRAARAFARSLGLKSSAEWSQYAAGRMPEKGTRPTDIPSNPHMTYKDHGWGGYSDWLGIRR